MSIDKTQLVWASLIGIVATASIAGIGTIEKLDNINLLLAPGYFMAAVIFQEGIHSDHAILFLVLAAILDCILFALLALFFIRMSSKKRITH